MPVSFRAGATPRGAQSSADPADRETWRVTKMKWKSKTDHTTIVYNPKVTSPASRRTPERYMLGSRSALAWIIDQQQAALALSQRCSLRALRLARPFRIISCNSRAPPMSARQTPCRTTGSAAASVEWRREPEAVYTILRK